MEATFTENHKYSINIDFNRLKRYIKFELEHSSPQMEMGFNRQDATDEMIYNAFAANPEYYLNKLIYLPESFIDSPENLLTIKNIVAEFFKYCLNGDKDIAYFVLKGGEVLSKFEDEEMANTYAYLSNGYIIKSK